MTSEIKPVDLSDDELEAIEQSLVIMLHNQKVANVFITEFSKLVPNTAVDDVLLKKHLKNAEVIKKDLKDFVEGHATARSSVKRIVAQAKIANELHKNICKGDQS